VSNEVRSAAVNKLVGVEFDVIKVNCILSFFVRLVLQLDLNKANQYRKSSETFLTTDKYLYTARGILGQHPWPVILLFLAHHDIGYYTKYYSRDIRGQWSPG